MKTEMNMKAMETVSGGSFFPPEQHESKPIGFCPITAAPQSRILDRDPFSPGFPREIPHLL